MCVVSGSTASCERGDQLLDQRAVLDGHEVVVADHDTASAR
jgi:hypothetical protein